MNNTNKNINHNLIVKKAIIPIAGLGTRFLPLSKAVPKELFPLVDKPAIHYTMQEIYNSGIDNVIFVTSPKKKQVVEYFKKSIGLEKVLKQRKKANQLTELEKLEELSENIAFSSVIQRQPLGDGHAILQAKELVGQDFCAVLFPDDVIDSEVPCISQLIKVFQTSQKPVVAIRRVPKGEVSRYGIVAVEKIANRIYKIKKIVEKPSLGEAPSDLAIMGRYVLTPEVFDYLKKTKSDKRGEIVLADTLSRMCDDNKVVYGYEFEGEWLDCGDKLGQLKSNFYLSLKDPRFGPELRKYIKQIL
jgi:UTP--glucose-1-phosphate uridylyltransferase